MYEDRQHRDKQHRDKGELPFDEKDRSQGEHRLDRAVNPIADHVHRILVEDDVIRECALDGPDPLLVEVAHRQTLQLTEKSYAKVAGKPVPRLAPK